MAKHRRVSKMKFFELTNGQLFRLTGKNKGLFIKIRKSSFAKNLLNRKVILENNDCMIFESANAIELPNGKTHLFDDDQKVELIAIRQDLNEFKADVQDKEYVASFMLFRKGLVGLVDVSRK